jgi:hypothetical protein
VADFGLVGQMKASLIPGDCPRQSSAALFPRHQLAAEWARLASVYHSTSAVRVHHQ